MKMLCHGIDISDNDIFCNKEVIEGVESDLMKVKKAEPAMHYLVILRVMI